MINSGSFCCISHSRGSLFSRSHDGASSSAKRAFCTWSRAGISGRDLPGFKGKNTTEAEKPNPTRTKLGKLTKTNNLQQRKTLVESMLDALVLVVETTISKMFWQIGSFPQISSGVNIIWKTSIWNTTHVWSFFPSSIFRYPMESMHAYIYPHEWLTLMVNVGKDSSPMDPMGILL